MDIKLKESIIINKNINSNQSDLKYLFSIYYRILRKIFNRFLRKFSSKKFTNILYVTINIPPKEYIYSFTQQHPDKTFMILVPHIGPVSTKNNEVLKFEYFSRNKKQVATCYKYSDDSYNIPTYGIYSEEFSSIDSISEFYKIQYVQAFAKCSRIFAQKFKPDIVHAEDLPYFLGAECSNSLFHKYTVLQTFHDLNMYEEIEPFWAFLNIADKNLFKKILKDKVIRKNIAALFGVKKTDKTHKINTCLDYIYSNFERYRQLCPINAQTNENILINRLNERIINLLPEFTQNKELFNPFELSVINSEMWALNSESEACKLFIEKYYNNYNYLKRGCMLNLKNKIHQSFDSDNFRLERKKNKNYLLKEFSEKCLKTKFTDEKLFTINEVDVAGYIDAFYSGILVFIPISMFTGEEDLKIMLNAVLKAFQNKKNIQIIINIPKNKVSNYIESFVKYMKSQYILEGKWMIITGDVNIPQLLAATDMVLVTDSYSIGVEDLIYTALHNGCVPIVKNSGICRELITDIFDDMNNGTGFRIGLSQTIDNKYSLDRNFEVAFLKALDFYTKSTSSWNVIIKNAINFDYSWNFELIEQYNNIYESL